MKRFEKVIKIFILCVLLAAMILALKISSRTVQVIFSALTLFAVLLAASDRLVKKEQWKEMADRIRPVAFVFMILLFVGLNLLYNGRNLAKVLPLVQTTNQVIYQDQFAKEQSYPDAYIRQLIRGKTVVIPNEPKPFDFYNKNGDEEQRQEKFPNRYYKENNFSLYFKAYAKDYRVDETMPDIDGMTAFAEEKGDAFTGQFSDLGIANDMLRYSFLLNEESIKESSYFWYSWFYYSFSVEKEWYPKVYVQREACEASDTLAAVWDKKGNLYLMPESFYAETFKKQPE